MLTVFNTRGHAVSFCTFCPVALQEDGLFRFPVTLATVSVSSAALYLLCRVRATGQRGRDTQMFLPYFALKICDSFFFLLQPVCFSLVLGTSYICLSR